MKYKIHYSISAVLLCLTLISCDSIAGEVRVGVAANFTAAMREIAEDFENTSGHTALISYGSTGKLYAQILHNAPFDLFLAADQQRPQLLERQELADHRFTYAIGKLALWSRDNLRDVDIATLKRGDFKRIALANPKTAPYGAAAVSVMQRLGLEEALNAKRVHGDSIAQTYQFVATGNVELGFVAMSQVILSDSGKHWEIPPGFYTPIRQDAVLLERGRDNPAALDLLAYLKQDAATSIIHRYGYATE
jgi:molybdate transport system substrate-binding protein